MSHTNAKLTHVLAAMAEMAVVVLGVQFRRPLHGEQQQDCNANRAHFQFSHLSQEGSAG